MASAPAGRVEPRRKLRPEWDKCARECMHRSFRRPTHESPTAVRPASRETAAAGLRAHGQAIFGEENRYLVGALPKLKDQLSASNAVRSQLPLRGSSGLGLATAPDSLLILPLKADTTGGHIMLNFKAGCQVPSVRTRPLQHGCDVAQALPLRLLQRRTPSIVGKIWIGTAVQKQSDNFQSVLRHSTHERRAALIIACIERRALIE
jgi:hypothetical protein